MTFHESPLMDASSQTDLDRLQGTWSQTYLEVDGVSEPPDDAHSVPGAVCIFVGNTFTVMTPDRQVLLEGTFELDASTTPRSVTWLDAIGEDAGKAIPAIYELTDRTFRFIAADPGAPRPTRFRTVPGLTLRAFVRVA